jgi:aminoglycoside phosphotransferase (APT) family kinase protein
VLEIVRAAGVRAPAPRYVDAAGEIFGTPCIVLEFVDGAPDEAPDDDRVVDELANELAAIHRIGIDELSFLRRLEHSDAPVLLHGDFWPGNALWKDGRLVAMVDWEEAAIGDPLADVANARLELLWAYGAEAMHTFTQRYAALTGVDLADLSQWDLWADRRLTPRIPEWGLDDATQSDMLAKRETFVAQARAAS